MADILLLHGFQSSSQSYFLPWLKERYGKNNIHAPDFPNPDAPHIDQWTAEFMKIEKLHFDVVVAHSLGGTFACSLLSRNLLTCNLLVLIGTSPGPKDNADMNTFLNYPLDFPAIRSSTQKIVVVQSLDDPWTIPEYGVITLKHTLGVGIFYADKGHFETPELPEDVIMLVDKAIQ